MTGSNIQPPRCEGDFVLWKCKMEVLFKTNFGIMLSIKYDFGMPKNTNGKELKEHCQTIKQWEDFTVSDKFEYHLLSVLPMQEINRVGLYNSTK